MTLKIIALGMTVLLAGAGAAAAQDMPMHMSNHDMHMMNSCKAMSHHRMMHNRGCMRMMKMHPDMMKSDGMMHH